VTATLSALTVADRTANPAARFSQLGRLAAAGTLVVGATFQVLAFALMPDFDKTTERLQGVADHSGQAEASKLFDLLAVPFLLAGVIVYVVLTRERAPRLAWAGGILLGFGMCGLMAAQGFEALQFALADDGRFNLEALADVVDNVSSAPVIVMAVMFIAGAALGILTISAALWRSRVVPRGVPILIVLFFIVDAPLSQPLIGHLIALVAAVWLAAAIMLARNGG
jgi:hypothetical protein